MFEEEIGHIPNAVNLFYEHFSIHFSDVFNHSTPDFNTLVIIRSIIFKTLTCIIAHTLLRMR